MTLDTTQTVGEIARQYPASVPVFEAFGIDYCCGGGRSLEDACKKENVALNLVLSNLASALVTRPTEDERHWMTSSLSELADHIVEQHHAYSKRELPRLSALAAKVHRRHAHLHPELHQILELVETMSSEMCTHMLKEEQVLFPRLKVVEHAAQAGMAPSPAFFGPLINPIHHMLGDHDDTGHLLKSLRTLDVRLQDSRGCLYELSGALRRVIGFRKRLAPAHPPRKQHPVPACAGIRKSSIEIPQCPPMRTRRPGERHHRRVAVNSLRSPVHPLVLQSVSEPLLLEGKESIKTMNNKKLWIALTVVIVGSFLVPGGVGYQMISQAPPIPSKVVTPDGKLVFTGKTIQDGQNVWQSIGAQEIGSIWGHGAYVAPDWTADWLHREGVGILQLKSQALGAPSFESLSFDQQAVLKARLIQEERTNTYDAATGTITISPEKAAVFQELQLVGAGKR